MSGSQTIPVADRVLIAAAVAVSATGVLALFVPMTHWVLFAAVPFVVFGMTYWLWSSLAAPRFPRRNTPGTDAAPFGWTFLAVFWITLLSLIGAVILTIVLGLLLFGREVLPVLVPGLVVGAILGFLFLVLWGIPILLGIGVYSLMVSAVFTLTRRFLNPPVDLYGTAFEEKLPVPWSNRKANVFALVILSTLVGVGIVVRQIVVR